MTFSMMFINIFIWRSLPNNLKRIRKYGKRRNCAEKAQIDILGKSQFCGRSRDQQWRHQLMSQLQQFATIISKKQLVTRRAEKYPFCP